MRQIRETRRVEDLILSFVSASSKTLRKDVDVGEQWKEELKLQTGQFIDILTDVVKSCGPHHSEVLQRLQSYRSGLTHQTEVVGTTSDDRHSLQSDPPVPTTLDWVLEDLFGLSSTEKLRVVQNLQATCSLKVRLIAEVS